MACGKMSGADGLGLLKQEAPAHKAIALQTGVRCYAMRIAIDEAIHNVLLEHLTCVQNMKGNAKLRGHGACICDIPRSAAAIFGFGACAPKAEHEADDLLALLLEQGGGHGAIHAAAHTYGDDSIAHP